MRGTVNTCVLVLNCMLICIYFMDDVAAERSPPRVMTEYGQVEGYFANNARVFKSIPYAGHVDGENRWKDPKFPVSWSGKILNATIDPPACPQPCSGTTCLHQEENCLFLNVYTPQGKTSSKLPVLVFIHGGAYYLGTSALYDGSYLASNSEIIVVTINYRLGALGFLVHTSLFGADQRGNYGIKDQIFALEWVQRNIHYFGGDKDDVTLSGQSAGAMSVAVLMTRKKHDNPPKLFHKAILESDPFGLNYQTTFQAKFYGTWFVVVLGCRGRIGCLQKKSYEDIVKAQSQVFPIPSLSGIAAPQLSWAPVLDSAVLPTQPLRAFQNGDFAKVPTLVGTTSAEGIFFVYGMLEGLGFKGELSKEDYVLIIRLLFGYTHATTIFEEDMYPADDSPDQRLLLSQVVTDYLFYCPTVIAAKASSNSNPVYSYIFDQPWKWNLSSDATINKLCSEYACHGAELPYVFHRTTILPTPEERKLADTVSQYWGQFVKTGNPNTPKEVDTMQTIAWPPNPNTKGFADRRMSVGPTNGVVYDDRKAKCDKLNSFGYQINWLKALYDAIEYYLEHRHSG